MSDRVRIVIFGSRSVEHSERYYQHIETLVRSIEAENKEVEIISGGAVGADKLAIDYAERLGVDLRIMNADWDKLGKSAGYVRNAEMAKIADIGICLWDMESKGTKHMLNLLLKEDKMYSIFMVGKLFRIKK